jgi:penicillin-insensitive murein endopeptidase
MYVIYSYNRGMQITFTATLTALFFFATQSFATPSEDLLGPWLDLQSPGFAVGPTQTIQRQTEGDTKAPWYGSLSEGKLLPAYGEGFVRVNSSDTSWGTGMMISLLENASEYYVKSFTPGPKVHIASIAQEHGGPYGPHKSHQNGLDADIYFVGQTKYESVLDKGGNITAKFNPQQNWDFWKLLVSQQILSKGKPTSVVYMIFIAPVLKQFLCEWAKAQQILGNPLDAEVMRRLRPTEGHHTHFHLRLKCSPYHTECYQQNEIQSGTGCPG